MDNSVFHHFRSEHLSPEKTKETIRSFADLGWIHVSSQELGAHTFIRLFWDGSKGPAIYPEGYQPSTHEKDRIHTDQFPRPILDEKE